SVVVLGGATPIAGVETLAFSIVDTASAILAQLAPADALALALDDHGSVVAMLASTDLLAAALAELAAVATDGGVVLVAAADAGAVVLVDSGFLVPLVAAIASDEVAPALDETGAIATDVYPGPAS